MPSQNKLKSLAVTLLALPILMSCQATPSPASSVIADTAAAIEADTCRDLQLPLIDRAEFDSASQYWRDLIVQMDAAWIARCE